MATVQRRLVGFVHGTIASMRYSVYKLGGKQFDTSSGVYIVDCSAYVDNILQAVYPHAYSNLVSWSGTEKPTTHDFFHFFSNLEDEPQRYWQKIDDVEKLRPGDILVFRYRDTQRKTTAGHVMIVMDKPIADEDAFFVRVADSAVSAHSQDTRRNLSGIGIGTMMLKVNPKTYQPSAYAWKVGARWKNNAEFAMARPQGQA